MDDSLPDVNAVPNAVVVRFGPPVEGKSSKLVLANIICLH